MDGKRCLFMELYKEKYGTKITREVAQTLVDNMVATGDSRASGGKWSYDDAVSLGTKLGVNWNHVSECEWYLVLNMMWSDYSSVGEKYGWDSKVYGELAENWFMDADGKPDKTFQYFIML